MKAKAMTVMNAIICEGEYEGKPYKNGRLLVGQYDGKSVNPAWVKVYKADVDITDELRKKLPCKAILFSDLYGNVIGYKEVIGN